MTTKFYTCTLLPEVTRDDPPKLGVRCNETGVIAAFWRKEDRALFAAAPDMAVEISKQIDWLKHARAELQGVARESLLLGFDQSIKYLTATLTKARGEAA